MAPPLSITATNAVLTLTQPTLFPTPVQLQQFATDDVYDISAIQSLEAQMGVDGFLSFGFVYAMVRQGITLQANSPSNVFFDVLWTQMQAAQDNYPLSGLIVLKGINTKFSMINGGLTSYKPAPDAKKVLSPRKYEITWGRIFPAPI